MRENQSRSFFAQMRQEFFDRCLNYEIFDRIFPHHLGEKDHGYSFGSREQMNSQTEEFQVHALLGKIEGDIQNMPDAYGESFRHIMHRDLHRLLRRYECVARKRVNRSCDPRYVAERLEPAG